MVAKIGPYVRAVFTSIVEAQLATDDISNILFLVY